MSLLLLAAVGIGAAVLAGATGYALARPRYWYPPQPYPAYSAYQGYPAYGYYSQPQPVLYTGPRLYYSPAW